MTGSQSAFWGAHLSSVEGEPIHFLSQGIFNLSLLKAATDEIGFRLFTVDTGSVNSIEGLFTAFDNAIGFPEYFGWNWNAFIDVMTDLSWQMARGYVVVVTHADRLRTLDVEQRTTFLQVCQAIARSWRDERGEFGERAGPVPFHFLFVGSNEVRDLEAQVRGSFCEHSEHLAAHTVRARQ